VEHRFLKRAAQPTEEFRDWPERRLRATTARLRRRTPHISELFTQNTSTANTESFEILIMVKNYWDSADCGSTPKKSGNALMHVDAILATCICHF